MSQIKINHLYTHHSGNVYKVLGLTNQGNIEESFIPSVVYANIDNLDHWYSCRIQSFLTHFTHNAFQSVEFLNKDGTMTVLLGEFGKINRKGQFFTLEEEQIISSCKVLLNKSVGELNTPQFEKEMDSLGWLDRVLTNKPENSAGVLLRFECLKSDQHGMRDVIKVIGTIKPSPQLLKEINRGTQPYFGMRCMGMTTGEMFKVDKLVCFDVLIENPRFS